MSYHRTGEKRESPTNSLVFIEQKLEELGELGRREKLLDARLPPPSEGETGCTVLPPSTEFHMGLL